MNIHPQEPVIDSSFLVSLIVIGPHGFGGYEASLERVASSLRQRYAFFEILLIAVADGQPLRGLVEQLGRITPQIRVLQIGGASDFDRLAVCGYQECIGDIVVMSSVDEIGFVDFEGLIDLLRDGKELVRLRRKSGSVAERLSSLLVRSVTGLQVDTRFYRTLGLNRQLLSELLSRPEEIHLFRFTAHARSVSHTVVETDQPQTRRGFQGLMRRIDLVARLIATAAPRLLRIASALCLALALGSLLSLLYVLAVWLLRSEIAEGWTTTISLMALWMFVQLSATSVLCLGLSRILDRHDRIRVPRLVDETTVGDLFSAYGLLNVEDVQQAEDTQSGEPAAR